MDEENDAFPFQDEENGNGEDPLNEFGGERVSADTADGNGGTADDDTGIKDHGSNRGSTGNSGTAGNGPSSDQTDQRTKGKDSSVLASELCMRVYDYAKVLKGKGHTTLSDMLFKEMMNASLNSNIASGAVGRERFINFIENAYYSVRKVDEYLKFIEMNGIICKGHYEIKNDIGVLTKMMGSAVHTVRSKKTAPAQADIF